MRNRLSSWDKGEIEKKCTSEWQSNPAIREEFRDLEIYVSYEIQRVAGNVKILKPKIDNGPDYPIEQQHQAVKPVVDLGDDDAGIFAGKPSKTSTSDEKIAWLEKLSARLAAERKAAESTAASVESARAAVVEPTARVLAMRARREAAQARGEN